MINSTFSNANWWLNNDGSQNGLIGEDIGYPEDLEYNGTGITINVCADGALYNHTVHGNRARKDLFLNAFNEKENTHVFDPENDFVGEGTLSLAGGEKNGVCGFSGVAPGASLASLLFYSSTKNAENLQYVICQNSESWDINILQYALIHCSEAHCSYVETDEIDTKMADSCLYNPPDGRRRVIVVPSGDYVTDVLFSPPTRWPLMFVIAGVTNRGMPIPDTAEGVGIFMACPSSWGEYSRIKIAIPNNTTSCGKALPSSLAASAIFGGAIATILQVRKNMTIADLFYITAMTSTKVVPHSILWQQNSFGLWFNRRVGFGRLNLSKAIELTKKWQSVGDLHELLIRKDGINLQLYLAGDSAGMTINVPNHGKAVHVRVLLKLRDPHFSSLQVMLTSPSGTKSDLKLQTEVTSTDPQDIELPTYQFLGEDINGNWTITFPSNTVSDRGLIVNAVLGIYYTDVGPQFIADQSEGKNPYTPIENTSEPLKFLAPLSEDEIVMNAGTEFSTYVSLEKEYENIPLLFYLENEERTKRVRLENAKIESQKLIISHTPTVYSNAINPVYLVVESLTDGYGFTSRMKVTYNNDLPSNTILSPSYKSVISANQTSLNLTWTLNFDDLLDDGYITYACISIITETRKLLKRIFVPNTGNAYFENAIPTNREFVIEIAPTGRQFAFRTLLTIVDLADPAGPKYSNNLDFSLTSLVSVAVILGITVLFETYKLIAFLVDVFLRSKSERDLDVYREPFTMIPDSSDIELEEMHPRNFI